MPVYIRIGIAYRSQTRRNIPTLRNSVVTFRFVSLTIYRFSFSMNWQHNSRPSHALVSTANSTGQCNQNTSTLADMGTWHSNDEYYV